MLLLNKPKKQEYNNNFEHIKIVCTGKEQIVLRIYTLS